MDLSMWSYLLDNVILILEEWISFNSKIDVGCQNTNKL